MTDSYGDNSPLTVKPIPANANILNTSLCTNVLDKTCLMQQSIGESIVHKNVRSRDSQDGGNVDAIMGDIVVITTQGDRREYNLPKTQVVGFNGAEVLLKNTLD